MMVHASSRGEKGDATCTTAGALVVARQGVGDGGDVERHAEGGHKIDPEVEPQEVALAHDGAQQRLDAKDHLPSRLLWVNTTAWLDPSLFCAS